MLELIYFQTGSPLVMVIVWYITYSPFSQLEWPIIMTKQLLMIFVSDAHIGLISDQSEC